MANDISLKMLEACRKQGIPAKVVRVNLSPEKKAWLERVREAVRVYMMKIEQAHKEAAHSTLHFRASTKAPSCSVSFFF